MGWTIRGMENPRGGQSVKEKRGVDNQEVEKTTMNPKFYVIIFAFSYLQYRWYLIHKDYTLQFT